MEYYLLVKHLHMTAAVLSLLGFLLRGFWMLNDNPLLGSKLSKILPHIIDTVLLSAAIYLVVMSGLYPFVVNWVTVKVLLLVVYIIAGTIALKRGKTRKMRSIALVVALASISLIFVAAILKNSLIG